MVVNPNSSGLINFRKNFISNWRFGIKNSKLLLLASENSNKLKEIKEAVFLNFLWDKGMKIYNTLEFELPTNG